MRVFVTLLLCASLAACYGSTDKYHLDASSDTWTPDGPDVPDIPNPCSGGTTKALGTVDYPPVDILVVVDNSMSMAEEQANLATNFPILIQTLLNPDIDPVTGRPEYVPVKDLHIGVISTDMGTGGYSVESCSDPIDGDNGELQHTPNPSVPGCDTAYPIFLSYLRDDPDPAEIDHLSTSFGCIAILGIDGCGFEQQLKASVKALVDHRDGVNAGFLRPHSLLTVLFVTDEEDCSVAPGNEGIFDMLDSSLGHMNLRCFHHPYMIDPVDLYIDAFASLRDDPDDLVLAFIVGVPRDLMCEGYGNAISNCLDHPDMMEQVDPVSMTRLVPSCVSTTGEAYPPRRFVRIAQEFGANALVQSVCAEDFRPAIGGLTAKIQKTFEQLDESIDPLTVFTESWNPCRCISNCYVVEALKDLSACESHGKPCYEPHGPGTGCASPAVSPDGSQHTLCEIPQAGTLMEPCSPSAPTDCHSGDVRHTPSTEGWYYMGPGWRDHTGSSYLDPTILFTGGMEPENGSIVYLACCP